jgi:predicted transcriptional regulator
MSEVEVPLKPLGREDIQKLEAVLLLGTCARARKDVIEKMRSADPKDRITWIDSLAVAAGALAREKAGMGRHTHSRRARQRRTNRKGTPHGKDRNRKTCEGNL